MKTLKLVTLLLAVFFLNSCSDDNDEPQLPKGNYENGYFVTNEGPFQNGTGSITFLGEDKKVYQNIYEAVNGEVIGNLVQSMTLEGEYAYIVVSGSNKVIVANRYTMKKITTIEGSEVNNPRYMVVRGDKAYLSNWGNPSDATDDFVTIIDLLTNKVTSTIAVGQGPEHMLIVNNMLYVALEGGWSQNNIVEVIDTNTDLVKKSIEVAYKPNSMSVDNSGNVWVLCGGKPAYTQDETLGALVKITANNFETMSLDFPMSAHPNHLTGEADNLYYTLDGKVYNFKTDATELPTAAINGLDGFYYSMKVKNNVLYTTDAGDYASEGTLREFDIATGTLLYASKVGVIPGDIVFQ